MKYPGKGSIPIRFRLAAMDPWTHDSARGWGAIWSGHVCGNPVIRPRRAGRCGLA